MKLLGHYQLTTETKYNLETWHKRQAASERQNCHGTYIRYESKEEVVALLRIVANS